MLMISANCHPWYLTWLLPLLVLVPVPGLLLWTALVPLAYSAVIAWVETGEWIEVRSPYSGDLVGRVPKGGAQVGQSQWEHRLRRRAAIGADEQNFPSPAVDRFGLSQQ